MKPARKRSAKPANVCTLSVSKLLFMIPESPNPDCPHCATRAGVIDRTCRACVARDLARWPSAQRNVWYVEAAKECGAEAVKAFKSDIYFAFQVEHGELQKSQAIKAR